jgi:hypothetical protein
VVQGRNRPKGRRTSKSVCKKKHLGSKKHMNNVLDLSALCTVNIVEQLSRS